MSVYPQDFRAAASGCFLTSADEAAEERAPDEARQAGSLASIDASMDELCFRIGALASPECVGRDDADHAAAFAADLAALVAKHFTYGARAVA